MRSVSLLMFLLGVAPLSAADAPKEVKPTEVWTAVCYSREKAGSKAVLRIWDVHGWQQCWKELIEIDPPPTPDFAKGSAVIVTAGEYPFSGHWVEVVRAVHEEDVWIVEFIVKRLPPEIEVVPTPVCPVASAFFRGIDLGQRPRWRDVTPREGKDR